MKRVFVLLTALLLWQGAGTACRAAFVPISGYDINDAVLSGHGNWAHTYSGTITPGLPFNNGSFPGTTGTYSGVGSGTLNDGVIGTSHTNSQLFVVPASTSGLTIDPTIFLTLSVAYTIDTINIFGGNISGNSIPGALSGFTVTLLKTDFTTISDTFVTTPFGPNNGSGPVDDSVSLIGSSLQNVPAFAVFLSKFTGTNNNWFSITEIELDGNLAPIGPAVPEPASLALFGIGAAGLGLLRRRKSS